MRPLLPLLGAMLGATMLACRGPSSPSGVEGSLLEVAVTVDDLPMHGPDFAGIDRVAIADRLLAVFRAHHLPPVYGFVNGEKVDQHPESVAVLQHWLAAGNPLGNHTYSHIGLNDATVSDYVRDLEKGEAILRRLVPDASIWKVFRYPYLFEGDTLEKHEAVRGYLATHGYLTAEVTIDGDDWAWNAPFARCKDRHDEVEIAALLRGYVKTQVSELRYMRVVTRLLAGRDVKHVLLLHVGAADAEAMDALLTAYESEGVRWIDLPTALRDPFYAQNRNLPYKAGAAFPYPVARARDLPLPTAPERPEEERLKATCR